MTQPFPLADRGRARRSRARLAGTPAADLAGDVALPGAPADRLEQRDRLLLNLLQGMLAERIGQARRLEAMRDRIALFGVSGGLALSVVIGLRFDALSPAAVVLAAAIMVSGGPAAALIARSYQQRLEGHNAVAGALRGEIAALSRRLLAFDPDALIRRAEAAHEAGNPARGPSPLTLWLGMGGLVACVGIALMLLKLFGPSG